MKPILIHTHFHKRKTGVTRSIENILPYFDENFETYVYGSSIDGNKISTKKVKSYLFSNAKVIVHCHRNNELMRMLWYRFLGAKFTLIATRHSATKPSRLTRFLLQKADKVVTLIASMRANLVITNTLVSHGVNVDEFKPKEAVVLKNIKQPNIILNAGRVRKAKGQQTLLEAAACLQKYRDWALVIVGKVDKPDFFKELQSIAKKNKIEEQVYFIPETRDIIPYYQAAKIVVAPSFSEGFSLVTAEAMSCACTVIATKDVGVHSALITHGKTGYLFEPGDEAALTKLISNLIEEKTLYLGNAARTEVVQNWSAAKEAKALSTLYQS